MPAPVNSEFPKGEVYAIVHDRLGKRVGSLKQLGEQNLKKLLQYHHVDGAVDCARERLWPLGKTPFPLGPQYLVPVKENTLDSRVIF